MGNFGNGRTLIPLVPEDAGFGASLAGAMQGANHSDTRWYRAKFTTRAKENEAIRKSWLKRAQSSPASIMRMSVEMSAP